MKKLVSFVLALVLAASLLPIGVLAADTQSGKCGTNAAWSYDANTKTLTISGTGAMEDYNHDFLGGDYKESPWDEYREEIESVIVGNGITKIGNDAFGSYYPVGVCPNLNDVVIGSGVQQIGDYAFAGAESLKSVDLPQALNAIDFGVFEFCTSLQTINVASGCEKFRSVDGVLFEGNRLICYPPQKSGSSYTVPDGTTVLSISSFENADNLNSVQVPGSVKEVEADAFRYCSNLQQVTFSEGTEKIDVTAFHCSPLCRLVIPASVTEFTVGLGMSEQAWDDYWYTEPLSVFFQGMSAPAFDGYIAAGRTTTTKATVYYPEGASGWDVVQAQSNVQNMVSRDALEFKVGTLPDSIYTAKPGKLALAVYENRNGGDVRETAYRLSEGASVSSGSASAVTDAGGQASVAYTGGAVTVSKTGYVSRTVSEAALKVNPKVWLQQESDNPVISAVWMDEVNDIMNAEYSLPLVQSEAHNVSVEVNWGKSSMKSLMLAQGTATVALSGSGQTSVTWSDHFDLSKTILVVATNAEGKQTSKVLKIKSGSEATKPLEGFKVDFGNDLQFTLPDSIPVIGGESMKIGIYSNVLISYVVENGKIYAAVGYQADEKNDKDGTEVKSFVQSMKDIKKSAKKLSNMFAGKLPKVEGSWGVDVGFHIAGYLEGYFDQNNQIHWQDTGFFIGAEGGVSFTGQFAIGPVPAYFEAGLKAELEAKLALAMNESVKSFNPNGIVSGAIKINIGLGAGVKKGLSGGGGVEGKIDVDIDYKDRQIASSVAKLSLGGYLKVTFVGLEYKHDFDPWVEKIIFEYPDYSSNQLMLYAAAPEDETATENFYEEVYTADNYIQPDLSYLAAGSAFLANGNGSSRFMRTSRAVNVDSVTNFLSNSYENAAPQLLCLSDGTMLAVWTGYDSTRSGMDSLCLFYSRYDGSSWTEPVVLDDDGTMDCGFTLREINGQPCVVWEDASGTIESTDGLTEVAAKLKISLACFSDGQFTISDVSTGFGADMMPDVCCTVDGSLAVVWLRNSNNDPFANDGSNEIMCRRMTAEGWSEEETLCFSLQSVDSLSACYDGSTLQVAYSMDTDGDMTTSEDMEVYINGSAATSNSVIDSGVQYVDGQLYWYEDGTLMHGGSEMVPASSGLNSDRYQVVNGGGIKAVLFTTESGVYSSLYGIFCDTASGTWGEPVALTDGSDCIRSFSAVATSDGIQVLVNRIAVTDAESTENPYGTAQIDIIDLTLGSDLAIEDVYCDMQYYMANRKLPMTITVSNKGRQAVDQVQVTFLDESGTQLGTETLNAALPAGVTQELETGLAIGEVVQGRKVTIQVLPVDDSELDTSDNTAELTLQQQDIALESMSWGLNADGKAVIYGDVVNRGYTASGTLTVSLRKDGETAPIVNTISVESLDTLELQRISFETTYEENAVYYLTLDGCEDDSVANNSNFIVLRQEPEAEIVGEVIINASNFPDENFRTYLTETFDQDGDGRIDVSTVTQIDCSGKSIQSLQGVELLTELCELDCANNQLTALDVSMNEKLQNLDCSTNIQLAAVTLPPQPVCVDTTGNGSTVLSREGSSGVTVSGQLDAVGLKESERVYLMLKQGDTICGWLRTGEETFSFADIAVGSYTLQVYQDEYVSREYTVEVGTEEVELPKLQLVRRGNINGACVGGIDVEITDLACLYQYLTEGKNEGSIQDKTYFKAVADVNDDGSIDVYDLQRLYEAVSGVRVF